MIQIPNRSASPEEVRIYITQALISKHNASHEFAEETARLWRLGRGSELHDAELGYFQQLFGVEAGLLIFRSVCEDRQDAWARSPIGRLCNCKLSIIIDVNILLTL